jgi:hypothetical protein
MKWNLWNESKHGYANMKSELQKMRQTITARATAGEQNSKWWLTPTNKYYEL